jgi:predicted acylesterase/phospholipase RssA
MKYLVLGPGGQGFFMMLGYLKKIEDTLSDVEEISGASAGAMVGLALACGKTIDEIMDFSINVDVEGATKLSLKSLLKNFGCIDSQALKPIFQKLCGGNPRFKDLKLKLYVSAMCVNTSETVYFSRDTHADMHVIDAVCASIAVPLLFAACSIGDKLYVDGGVLEEIPVFPFLHKNMNDVISVSIQSKTQGAKKIIDLKTYIINVVFSIFSVRFAYPQVPVVHLDCSDVNILDFKMSTEDKLRLYIRGLSK